MSDDTPTPAVQLEYRSPPPPRPPRWAGLRDTVARLGPFWPRPSVRTLWLLVPLIAAFVGVHGQRGQWRAGRSQAIRNVAQSSGGDWSGGFRAMPGHDAVVCIDIATGEPIVWRPWDDKVLVRCTGARTGALSVDCSTDESCILAQTYDGLYLWRTDDGSLIHNLAGSSSSYLPVGNVFAAALSSHGDQLVTLNHHHDLNGYELTVWDVTGPRAVSLAHRSLDDSVLGFGATLQFAPDGHHLLLTDSNRIRLVDTASLTTLFERSRTSFDGRTAAWVKGGQAVIVTESATSSALCVYDCNDGRQLQKVTLVDLSPASVIPSPTGTFAAVVSHNDGGACVDFTPAGPVVRQPAPLSFASWGTLAYFADGHRAVVSSWAGIDPMVVDLATGHQLGTLPLPPPPLGFWNPQPPTVGLAISADEQHVAARLGNGNVQVFDRIAPDSVWGVAGTVPFALAGIALALVLWSAHRDAAGEAGAAARHPVAAIMVTASAPALLYLCTSLALGQAASHYWWNRNWVPLLLALWFPAGLGLRMKSPLWIGLAQLLLLASVGIALMATPAARSISQQPFQLLDRTCFLPMSVVASVTGIAAGVSIGLLTVQMRFRSAASNRLGGI